MIQTMRLCDCVPQVTSFFSIVGEKGLLYNHKVRSEVKELFMQCCVYLENNSGHIKRQNDSEFRKTQK